MSGSGEITVSLVLTNSHPRGTIPGRDKWEETCLGVGGWNVNA